MSNLTSNSSSYSLIDDDHIDDKETIDLGNLIIDLENNLENEQIENEQGYTKPNVRSKTSVATSSSNTSQFNTTSSTTSSSAPTITTSTSSLMTTNKPTSTTNSKSLSGGRANQKTSAKHSSNSSYNNTTSSNTSSSINNNNNKNSTDSTTSSNTTSTSNHNNSINSSTTIIANNSSSNNNNANNNINISTNNDGQLMTGRPVFKTSADDRGELKMKITRETKASKSEHKVTTSPNHKSPPPTSSASGGSNIGDTTTNVNTTTTTTGGLYRTSSKSQDVKLNLNLDELYSAPSQSSSISCTKEMGTSTSVGTITEPECLGPCEPGTSVTLEGIVWQETEGGILVVNVTWRGKTYVGALLDCTKHDWAPPQLCDSPASDVESKANKSVRTKRIVTRSNGVGVDEKNLLQTTGKLRNGKGRRIVTSNELASCNKKQRESEKGIESGANAVMSDSNTSLSTPTNESCPVPMSVDTTPPSTNTNNVNVNSNLNNNNEVMISTSNNPVEPSGLNSPMLIGCSEPNCSKKYRNQNGLAYHQAHAHNSENHDSIVTEENDSQDNDKCSSSYKEEGDKDLDSFEKINTSNHQPIERESLTQAVPIFEKSKTIKSDVKSSEKQDRKQTPKSLPSHQHKLNNKTTSNTLISNDGLLNQEPPRASIVKTLAPDIRGSSNSSTNHGFAIADRILKSPGSSRQPKSNPAPVTQQHQQTHPPPPPPTIQPLQPQPQHHNQPLPTLPPLPHGISNQGSLSSKSATSSSSSSSSGAQNKQQSNSLPPLPATTEEGMKPSGTSTGPPPAPHQTNYYFNSAFLSNSLNPYAFGSYFARPPLPPMYDPLAPPNSPGNAAFFARFMNNVRGSPPLDSSVRLPSPSMPNGIPPFPGPLPVPPPPMLNSPLPHMPQLPPLPGAGSPQLRPPGQNDSMCPPGPLPPFPSDLNPLRIPGLPNHPLPPSIGGPQLPNLSNETLNRQFPGRFN